MDKICFHCLHKIWKLFLIDRRTERDMTKMYIGLHVKYYYFNENWIFSESCRKYSNIKFHENLFLGSREVTCGRTGMAKLIVVFRIYANAPERD